jgi:hypothetical protein
MGFEFFNKLFDSKNSRYTFEVKLNSIALAAVVAHAMDEKN